MNERSTMQSKVDAYLGERRREGFSMKIAGQQLSWFAQFTDATGYRGPLTIELASRWALANRSGRRLTAARRIEVLRAFARYCRSWDQRSEIPPLRLFGLGHRRLTPHIYRNTEIRALMRAARALYPAGKLRAEACATIIGLMASSGLRISEVRTAPSGCRPRDGLSAYPPREVRQGTPGAFASERLQVPASLCQKTGSRSALR